MEEEVAINAGRVESGGVESKEGPLVVPRKEEEEADIVEEKSSTVDAEADQTTAEAVEVTVEPLVPSLLKESAANRELFKKWYVAVTNNFASHLLEGPSHRNIDQYSQFATVHYGGKISESNIEEVLRDIFNSPSFRACFQVVAGRAFTAITGEVKKLNISRVPCSLTSMEFFDRLEKEGIVAPNGSIKKCLDDVFDDITTGNLVRDLIVNEDSENYFVYDDDEREEFLFRVFSHAAVGGSLCQWDDEIAPYLEVTKRLYKDLLSVGRHPVSGKIEVLSSVYEVKGWEGPSQALFPNDNMMNHFFVIVDPKNRSAKLWYSAFVPFW